MLAEVVLVLLVVVEVGVLVLVEMLVGVVLVAAAVRGDGAGPCPRCGAVCRWAIRYRPSTGSEGLSSTRWTDCRRS